MLGEIQYLVYEAAKEQGCPSDRLDDVWMGINASSFQLPTSRKQIESDVSIVMRGLGL